MRTNGASYVYENVEELRDKLKRCFKEVGYNHKEIELLYAAFSETTYCATWLYLNENIKDEFVAWLIDHNFMKVEDQVTRR